MKYNNRLQLFFGALFISAIIVWVAFFTSVRGDADNNLKIYFLNVGQGDAEYIKMPSGEDILIDGGPDDKVLNELGKVMDFGDRKIDLVILTHPHADHLTGLVDVINRYEIGEVWDSGVEYPSATYDRFKNDVKTKNIPEKFVVAGDEKNYENGNIKFQVLYPLSSEKNKTIDNLNNATVVTSLENNKFSALFMGDLEKSVPLKLNKNYTVLKVAHHGSENGLSEDLLKVIRPAIAVIEVGQNNKFGHPTKTVIDLLKNYAVQIYRTDQNGTVVISSDGVNYTAKTDK